MGRIKVLHLANTAWFVRYLLLNQLKNLQDAGYDVVAAAPPGPEGPAVEAAGVQFVGMPMTRTFSPGADLLSLVRLYRLMRREGFTLVHTHNPKPGLVGQLAARMAGVPLVVNTLHGFYFHDHMGSWRRRFYVAMEKVAACCSTLILSQSAEDVRAALRERICPPERIRHLGNGIDVRRFDRSQLDKTALVRARRAVGLPETGPVVGFVGRLVAEKGVRELMAAARLVAARVPAVRFLVIGPVDYEKPDALTPAIAREFGVETCCVFPGMRQDMPELYGLMDVFTLPSYREGFPRALMEAAAMEVPCVATDIRGCREAVIQGRNGLLVPVKDGGALAAALLQVLADEAAARRMGREGRRLALERFDERLVFRTVREEYARLLRDKEIPAVASEGMMASVRCADARAGAGA